MLKVINLYVIDKIFDEVAEDIIGQRAKMLYINCLINYFKDKKPTVANAVAFDLFTDIFGKDFEKYKPFFTELERAGLVQLGSNKVGFNNVWGNYIDRTLLEKMSPDEYVGNFKYIGIESFEADLRNNMGIYELGRVKFKILDEQIGKLIEVFILEQKTFNKTYMNLSDCVRHLTYWLPHQIKNEPKEAQKQVKSNSKILGL